MNIAVVTITKDDRGARLEQWKSLYEEYAKDVYLHVIVDNASSEDYKKELEDAFPNAVIIHRRTNGGCTGAYNDGIRYCLENKEIDAIALMANDIKLSNGALPILYNLLLADEKLGMISPVECKPETDIVEQYGHKITSELTMECLDSGVLRCDVKEVFRYAEMLPGGVNLAKVDFYRAVGLQDEKLFMYSDEIDTAMRAKSAGIMLGVTTQAVFWHLHISNVTNQQRSYACNYLMCRNKMYLAQKHFSKERQKKVKRFYIKQIIRDFIFGVLRLKGGKIMRAIFLAKGLQAGKNGDMELNKYTTM